MNALIGRRERVLLQLEVAAPQKRGDVSLFFVCGGFRSVVDILLYSLPFLEKNRKINIKERETLIKSNHPETGLISWDVGVYGVRMC